MLRAKPPCQPDSTLQVLQDKKKNNTQTTVAEHDPADTRGRCSSHPAPCGFQQARSGVRCSRLCSSAAVSAHSVPGRVKLLAPAGFSCWLLGVIYRSEGRTLSLFPWRVAAAALGAGWTGPAVTCSPVAAAASHPVFRNDPR